MKGLVHNLFQLGELHNTWNSFSSLSLCRRSCLLDSWMRLNETLVNTSDWSRINIMSTTRDKIVGTNFTFMWPCIVTNFFLIKPTDALISQICFVKKLYIFLAVPLPIIRSFPLHIRHWYMSCRFDNSFQARPGWNCSSILVVLEDCHQNYMTYTSAECAVENSWWWAEKLPETCRVSWQNKFGKLVRLLVWVWNLVAKIEGGT